jgi:hypothetical protein
VFESTILPAGRVQMQHEPTPNGHPGSTSQQNAHLATVALVVATTAIATTAVAAATAATATTTAATEATTVGAAEKQRTMESDRHWRVPGQPHWLFASWLADPCRLWRMRDQPCTCEGERMQQKHRRLSRLTRRRHRKSRRGRRHRSCRGVRPRGRHRWGLHSRRGRGVTLATSLQAG